MNRRKFLQFLGLAPLAVTATQFLPKDQAWVGRRLQEFMRSKANIGVVPASDSDYSAVTMGWQPNRAYKVGDIILINNEKHRVVWAGTSGETQPPKSEWHRLSEPYRGAGYEVDLIDKTVGYKKI